MDNETDEVEYLPVILNQLSIINDCLENLKQDLGGEIEKTDDYISTALKSCSTSKEIINAVMDDGKKNRDKKPE